MGKEKEEGTGEDISKIQTKVKEERTLLLASDGKPSDVEDDSNGENESEWRVAHDKKSNKDLILGGQKKKGNKDTSSKKSQSKEGRPSSSEPDNDKPMNEQEGTDAKRNSTRSGRRKRRNGDLKMSNKRKLAYGIITPKRPKNH